MQYDLIMYRYQLLLAMYQLWCLVLYYYTSLVLSTRNTVHIVFPWIELF